MIHGDVKPRNVVRKTNILLLVDMDMCFTTSKLGQGQHIGYESEDGTITEESATVAIEKILASSAYCCPETFKWAKATERKLQSIRSVESEEGLVPCDVAKTPSPILENAETFSDIITAKLVSPEQVDCWGFGATLFEMACGQALIPNSYDKAGEFGMDALMNWAGFASASIKALEALHPGGEISALLDLLQWLLDPSPDSRPTDMREVIAHAFFNPTQGIMRENFVVERIRHLLHSDTGPRQYANVMISYCWADTNFVLSKLAIALAPKVDGLWLDRLGGDEGMGEWTRASMEAGVSNAEVIIAVVSPSYVKSKNCGFEMDLANKYGKTIIPIMFGVPFSEWPPAVIGVTPMSNQFNDPKTGDMKLFVDFTDLEQFYAKLGNELLPRLPEPRGKRQSASELDHTASYTAFERETVMNASYETLDLGDESTSSSPSQPTRPTRPTRSSRQVHSNELATAKDNTNSTLAKPTGNVDESPMQSLSAGHKWKALANAKSAVNDLQRTKLPLTSTLAPSAMPPRRGVGSGQKFRNTIRENDQDNGFTKAGDDTIIQLIADTDMGRSFGFPEDPPAGTLLVLAASDDESDLEL